MRKRLTFLLLAAVYAGTGSLIWAQGDAAAKQQYIAIIKKHFEAPHLQYRYRVQVAATAHKQSLYDISGNICLSGQQYYDSSGTYIQLRNKDHFLSLNHENKTASLVSAQRYRSVFGAASLDRSNVIYDLPSAVLDSMTTYEISIEGSNKVLSFRFRQPVQGFQSARFVFTGQSLSEVTVVMLQTDRWGDQTGQLYTVRMHHFSHSVPQSLFSIQRFCTVSGQTVRWQSRYTKYQAYTLL